MSEPCSLAASPGPEPHSPPVDLDVCIPDHDLIQKIGEGSYGQVWLARTVTGSHRAVKIVRRRTEDEGRTFEREFRGIQHYEPISRLHPSLMDVLQVGRGDGFFYYIMEL